MRWREEHETGRKVQRDLQFTSVRITLTRWWEQWNMESSWASVSQSLNKLTFTVNIVSFNWGRSVLLTWFYSLKTRVRWKLITRGIVVCVILVPLLISSVCMFPPPSQSLSSVCLPVFFFLLRSLTFWPSCPSNFHKRQKQQCIFLYLYFSHFLSLWPLFSCQVMLSYSSMAAGVAPGCVLGVGGVGHAPWLIIEGTWAAVHLWTLWFAQCSSMKTARSPRPAWHSLEGSGFPLWWVH